MIIEFIAHLLGGQVLASPLPCRLQPLFIERSAGQIISRCQAGLVQVGRVVPGRTSLGGAVIGLVFSGLFGLLCAAISGAIARFRGYGPGFFGLLGFFLGPGGIGLTLLSAKKPPSGSPGVGFSPAEPVDASPALPVSVKAHQDYQRMTDYYRPLQLAVCLLVPAAFSICCYTFLWVSGSVLPLFAPIFEGMSIQLPFPTAIMLAYAKMMKNPITAAFFIVVQWALPVLAYLVWQPLARLVPGVSGYYHRLARVWLLTALANNQGQTTGLDVYLPSEFGFLARMQRADLEAQFGPLDADVQLERERLLATSWSYNAGLVVVATGLALLPASFLVMAVFLPLYQLIGNMD